METTNIKVTVELEICGVRFALKKQEAEKLLEQLNEALGNTTTTIYPPIIVPSYEPFPWRYEPPPSWTVTTCEAK